MSIKQRALFAMIGVVIAIAAIVILTSNNGETPAVRGSGSADQSSTSRSQGGTEAPQESVPVLIPGKTTILNVKKGDVVQFKVKVEKADELHVHGYDITRQLPAGKTVEVEFKADMDGIYEIELHKSDEQIATLKVQP